MEPFLEDGRLQDLVNLIGKPGTLCGLASAKGMALNGKRIRVVGFDQDESIPIMDRRIHCRLMDGSSNDPVLRIKMANIQSDASNERNRQMYHQAIAPPLSDQTVLTLLEKAYHRICNNYPDINYGMRLDIIARKELVKKHLDEKSLPNGMKCMDLMVPPTNSYLIGFSRVKLPCAHNSRVDFRTFNAFLFGNENECPICLDTMAASQFCQTLTCGHVFHDACIKKWVAQGSTGHQCPVCRRESARRLDTDKPKSLLDDLHEKWFEKLSLNVSSDHQEQIVKRYVMWFLGGMCVHCQYHLHEAIDGVSLPF
jgi:hypothetical protein